MADKEPWVWFDADSRHATIQRPVTDAGDTEPVFNTRAGDTESAAFNLWGQQSVFALLKDPNNHPEITRLGEEFSRIRLYRDLHVGREAPVRFPQKPDFPNDVLAEDGRNLALVLNRLNRSLDVKRRFLEALRKLYAGLSDFHVNIEYGTVQNRRESLVNVTVYVEGGGSVRVTKKRCRQGFSALFSKAGLSGRMPRIFAAGSREDAWRDFRTALASAGENDFIGDGFNRAVLPRRPDVENVSKRDLERGMSRATRPSSKGEYHKGRHSFEILPRWTRAGWLPCRPMRSGSSTRCSTSLPERHQSMRLIQRLRMPGLLSFPPDMDFFDLQSLNVLIGPNASGKSNLIDTLELLRALPTDFAAAVWNGGGAAEWLWKGGFQSPPAAVEVEVDPGDAVNRQFRYRLSFAAAGPRVAIIDELIDEPKDRRNVEGPYYYFHQGSPEIHIRVQTADGPRLAKRAAQLDNRSLDQSVLAQRKDPDFYPELFQLGAMFSSIRTFREWTFGPHGARHPQRTDLPSDQLLPDASNLALVLNQIEHKVGPILNEYLKRFFPRFKRMTTAIEGGTAQLYLHESGLRTPIPATRLSDGTIRFVALLATLLTPEPPRVVCIEEPELGLHPDAVDLLAELLVDASDRMQLVVTTHSDALVSALTSQPDAIVACERPGAGTELRRLDPEKLASWLENYRLGDLWRMGELGANP